ncbi:MAG TPA: hypothetical protein VHQ03_07500, partial [Candidatus Dormibacteraeota bacterium]|nr:hypothetical protein [Candidatus Dormibacteraeota bacterium]
MTTTDDTRLAALRVQRVGLQLRRRLLWLRSTWPAPRTAIGDAITDAMADVLARAPDRSAEASFYREHHAAVALGAEIAAVTRRLEEAAGLDRMALVRGRFGLDDFECSVLEVCFAVERSPGIDRLCAYLHDDLGLPCATPQLIIDLVGAGDPSLLRAFLSSARLRRFALVELTVDGRSLSMSPVRLDERMTAFLDGDDHVDHRLVGIVRLARAGMTSPDEGESAARLARLVAATAQRGGWPAVALLGSARAGHSAVASRTAELLNLALCELLTIPDAELTRLLEREAALSGFAYYARPEVAVQQHLDALVFFAGPAPEGWPGKVISLRLPAPDAQAQRALWTSLLVGCPAGDPETIEAIVQQFDLGSEDIR